MYKLIAYGILGQELKIKKFATKPTWSQQSKFANQVAVKYGAHPKIVIVESTK